MKKILIGIVVVLVLFAVAVLIIGRTFYPDNIAETSVDGGAKDLKTRFYSLDVPTVAKSSEEVISNLSTYGGSWKIVDKTDGGGVTGIKVEVPVIVFTDDFELRISKAENGKVQVDVKSQSRVGKSDFGENARHVRKFLIALDEKLN